MIERDVPLLLRGDPGRLRQVLANLVSNAIKFTHKGEVAIQIMLKKETPTQATIEFSVSDTGIGIPHDRIDSLFQPFMQLDPSTTRRYGGTGLGLVISKKLTEMMDGEIGLTSTPSKGSTFRFTAVLDTQPAERKHTVSLPPAIKDKKILIVEDNSTNRLFIHEQLTTWECRHDEASSGIEALEKLECSLLNEDPYSMVILDMDMPDMDGLNVLGRIKLDFPQGK